MKVHHGKIIETQMLLSGKKKQEIAKQLGITRQTLANKLKTPNLPIDFILKVGKILHFDFVQEIPEIKRFALSVVNETPGEYIPLHSKDQWKEKYLQLLETHNRILSEKESATRLLVDTIELLRKDLRKYFASTGK